jgi:hypothetical protein
MHNFISNRLRKTALKSAFLLAILYPVNSFAGPQTYGFKVVSHPTESSVAVRLVDNGTGETVSNAQLYTLRWVPGIGKGWPAHQVRVPLRSSGDGTFVAEAEPGDRLQLAAIVPGNTDPVTGSVFIGS